MRRSTLRPTAFVLVSTNHGSMLVNRHDYRVDGENAYGVGYELLNKSAFSQDEVDLGIQLLESRRRHFGDGVVAIDCGANIGTHTIEWAQFMFGWGQVISIEAQERIFYALAGNITLKNCFNAQAMWAAAGRARGSIRVPVPNYFAPSSFGSLELRKTERTEFIGQDIDYSEERMQEVQMIAIDDLALNRLDFLKIEIEGMEMEALSGARQSIEAWKPILMVEKIKSDEAELQRFVTTLGYRTFQVGLNMLAVHASDPVASQIQT
jgi:FkbM family methyltransferase